MKNHHVLKVAFVVFGVSTLADYDHLKEENNALKARLEIIEAKLGIEPMTGAK